MQDNLLADYTAARSFYSPLSSNCTIPLGQLRRAHCNLYTALVLLYSAPPLRLSSLFVLASFWALPAVHRAGNCSKNVVMQTQLQFHFARLVPLFMQSCCTLHVCLNLSDKFFLQLQQPLIAGFAAAAAAAADAAWPRLIYVQFNLNAQAPFNIKCKFNRACNRAGRCTLHVFLQHFSGCGIFCASGIKTANTPMGRERKKERKRERETSCDTA